MTIEKPKLTVILGGSEHQKKWRALYEEVIRPSALDEEKCAQVGAWFKLRGKLRLVRTEDDRQ